jgi:spermidine/putrescine ABC transporter ATP-binding subunit
VDDVTFEVGRGEFFSLLGPSGCGKTTLLRMLAGFESPTRGEITIDGQPMSNVPANRRPTNMVFQNYAIFPHLNVRQNIAYGLRRQHLPRKELDAAVDQALEIIKLPGYGSRQAHQLSGGQRQRVALARALVMRPKVLLLDEPLGALDKKLREEMQIELRQIQKSVGITFVLVTHDQEEALTMSDRVAVMSAGKVLQIDNPTQLYEAPNCREVADFIGTINLLEGTVTKLVDGYALLDGGPFGSLRAALGRKNAITLGTRAIVAVRPEKLQIDWAKPPQSHNVLEGCIGAEVYLGDRRHYHVRVSGVPKQIAVSYQNVVRTLNNTSNLGRSVWLSWSEDAAVLLANELS